MTDKEIGKDLALVTQDDPAFDTESLSHGGSKMEVLDRTKELHDAELEDQGPSLGSWRHFRFILIALCVCLCSGDTGMDGTVMSAINSMTQYQKFFNLKAASPKTGIVFGMYTIGQVCAFIPTSILPDRFGRRMSIFLGNSVLILGALLTANARNVGMFIAGRFLTGLGCTLASTTAKSYMSELVSPKTRGRWMGFLNSFYYIGQIIASGIAVPLGKVAGNYAWRTPLYIQGIPALICCVFILLCPESPRWLHAKGKQEKAAEIFAALHTRENNVNSPLVQLQMKELEEAIDQNGADSRWWDFRAIFATRSDRYRFGMCAIVSAWGQLAGNGLVTYYLTVLLGQAGITSPDRQRVLNFANSITSFAGALFGTSITDKVGRRKLMLYATASCTVGMCLIAGLLSDITRNPTRATAGIVFIFLFQSGAYSVGWTPLQGLYPAEVLTYENRSKGLALQVLLAQALSCINTFAMPVALANIQWKTYIFFAVFNAVGVVVVWLFVVETRRVTLEDLELIFGSRYPKKVSLEASKKQAEQDKADKEEMKNAGVGLVRRLNPF